jgi:hypothetical protein
MLNKVMKGSLANKVIGISSMLGIKLEDNVLSLSVTDMINHIKVNKEGITGEDMEITVQADIFNKLVQKTTAKEISIKLEEDCIQIKGNGSYKIELPLEDGELIKFPEIPRVKAVEKGKIKLADIKTVIENNKIALGSDMKSPELLGYHCSDSIITSNEKKAAVTDIKLFKESFLLCKEAIELLSVMEDEEIRYSRNNDLIVFNTKEITVFTIELENEHLFPVEPLQEYFGSLEEDSYCTLTKQDILDVLDRIILFVGEMDEHVVCLNFSKKGLSISSKKETGTEIIKYLDKKNFKPFECNINIQLLRDIVAVQGKGVVGLYYGDEAALKFIGKDCKHVVTLVEESENTDYGTDTQSEEDSVPF